MQCLPNIGSMLETDIADVSGLVSVRLPKKNKEYSNIQAWCSCLNIHFKSLAD